jgi:hypothetical protein
VDIIIIFLREENLPDESLIEAEEIVDRQGRQHHDLLGTWHGVVECPE